MENKNGSNDYIAPAIADIDDAAQLTKGEGGSSIEEQMIWGDFNAPIGENEAEDENL
jgi:hypothetical protein